MPSPMPQTTPDHAVAEQAPPKARRFAPEPIETITRSSKDTSGGDRKDGRPIRRFAPQPIETTMRSSREDGGEHEQKKSAPRRFAPEPIETTHKSSKAKNEPKTGSSHIRFKPQLVETTYGGNRKSSRQSSRTSEDGLTTDDEQKTPRRFTPVVLSTAKRSRRAGDSNTGIYHDHKTEEGHSIHAREHQRHAGWESPDDGMSYSEDDHAVPLRSHEEGRRQICPVDGSPPIRPTALTQSRTHSFRCPDLDTIESSESERESGPSSLSGSPGQGSSITASDSSFNEYYKHATRIRESIDENVNHSYLQSEAKKAAQRLLQEQALAAYPNSDFHEPVHHYVNDDQDSLDMEIEDRPVTWEGFDEDEPAVQRHRRESTKTPWEQLEMQRHAEMMQEERNANKITAHKKEEKSPWWNPAAALSVYRTDGEMRSMRDRARPPMLGRDIVFPRCPSPEPARFDVTQGCDTLRKQMSNLSQHPEEKPAHAGGLWAAAAAKERTDNSSASPASKSPTKGSPGKGLWGGFCVGQADNGAGGLMPQSGPTGLMTPAPRNETANPFEQSFADRAGGNMSLAPPTPPESVHGADPSQIDAILNFEREFDEMFEREYSDSFVTQVFNYLSLGYPTLARPFDEELSKISRIPISELRQDDIKAKQNPRGYIRLGPDFDAACGDSGLEPDSCVRWQALKLYIREWAKQEKDMIRVDAPGGNWATSNRRGSWAW